MATAHEKTFKNNLGKCRKEAGYTQAEVSEITGIALGTLRRWEQGKNEPDMASVIRLASLYKQSTDNLLGSRFACANNSIAPLSSDEMQLIDYYRETTPFGRHAILSLAREYSKHMPAGTEGEWFSTDVENLTAEDMADYDETLVAFFAEREGEE